MVLFLKKTNYYDKIAEIYDRTRWLTEAVAEEVADFIVDLTSATAETSFLEPGVGTGLNVLPLVKRGFSVTGIDISAEMLDRFARKFSRIPDNLKLIQADASKLPFAENSFDVILTVHMIHAVADWREFLDEIDRVLKPGGFYLNCQWITPPARKEFEGYFRSILAQYEGYRQESTSLERSIEKIDVEGYYRNKGYAYNYFLVKEWTVSNTVKELLGFFQARAYGLCWLESDEIFKQAIEEFEKFCLDRYSSLDLILSSTAKFEVWAYTNPSC